MRAKPRPRDREREIFEAVLPLFVEIGDPEAERRAGAWAKRAASWRSSRPAHVPRELKRLSRAAAELDAAAQACGSESLAELARLLPDGEWRLLLNLRARPGAKVRDLSPRIGAIGRSVRRIATLAGRPLPKRRRDIDRALLVAELAASWQAAGQGWPGWSRDVEGRMAGPFIGHLGAVFAAARLKVPKRSIIDRGLHPETLQNLIAPRLREK